MHGEGTVIAFSVKEEPRPQHIPYAHDQHDQHTEQLDLSAQNKHP